MPKAEFVDYYTLLEIAVESDEKIVNKAYRQKALKYHPDKNKGNDKATDMFKLVKEAKEILLDPAKRAAYDKKYRAVLMKKAGREKMDKRQQDLTESLFAREESAKRRKAGEMTENERILFKIIQIKQENQKLISSMQKSSKDSYIPTELPININTDFIRSSDYGITTLNRLLKAAEVQMKATQPLSS